MVALHDEAISPAALQDQLLSPFCKMLFAMDSRIIVHGLNYELRLDDTRFFFVTKDHIHIPYQLPAAEHEVAHAVEMTNKDRWLLPDWGMKMNPAINSNDITARRFFAAMAREVRVRSIQLHMEPSYRNDVSSSKYSILNNECAWGGYYTKRFLPFGRFRKYQDVEAWVHDLREKTYKAWSLDRIVYEWKIRLTAMQEYMGTLQQEKIAA